VPRINTQSLRRELTAGAHIPYTALVAPDIARTALSDYVFTLKLGGASFESAADETLNNWHERLNILWRNVAAPDVALWSHLVRRRAPPPVATDDTDAPDFARQLATRYRERLTHEALMVNEWYLSLVFRPVTRAATRATLKVLRRNDATAAELDAEALDHCAKLQELLVTGLERYEPEVLKVYQQPHRHPHRLHSRQLEFYGLLINTEEQPVPLPHAPLYDTLATHRLLFGREAIEFRGPTTSRFAAMLGIKEYPTPTVPGLLNACLAAPFPLVLTQSFAFLSRAAGQGLLQRQYHRMTNAGDFARSQAEELHAALDQLTSNQFSIGDHHLSLQVQSEPVAAGDREATRHELHGLSGRLAQARAILADTGMTVAREDLALEAAFWAQLPGNFPYRPRRAPITSRNFSALSPWHNHPTGRRTGNHWGEALATLITTAGSPYHFSLHASDPAEPDGGSRRDTGHTFLCGPTGSGKTVLIGFLVVMLARQQATQVIFDKDRGLEILVRALGGEYRRLRNGEVTGFNPLRLPVNPVNLEFLKTWLHTLLATRRSLTAPEAADLEQALHGTLQLAPAARRLSRLLEFLDPTGSDGLHARLRPWCESQQGDYAWVFDHENDTIAARLAGPDAPRVMGFDVTECLDHPTTRTPVTLYLFHVVRQLLDGRRLVCWMDEFWRMLQDPAFEQFAKDGPKTWRKLNAVMCLATQNASDVLGSPLSRTIIEQTPTKIFFPNPDAQASDYRDGFGLTEREFQLVHEGMEPGSRQFLVKQGHHSIGCTLNLKGFDAELAVISARAASLVAMQRLIAACGSDPGFWLPHFIEDQTRPPGHPANPADPKELP
jgi:type IV secretion system protein VirB4